MKRLLTLALLSTASFSFAGTYFYQGDLTMNSPTYNNPGGSSLGNQAYSVFQFTVDTTGAYTFEMASPNTATVDSNALDTFLALYTNSFNPASPGSPTTSNDDFTGSFTVLPGPFGIGSSGTGFTGAQPASRLLSVNLTTGVQYFLINTSFRSNNFTNTGTTNGLGIGHFYQGISGPGNINPVPEPASMAALGLGAMALLRRRKKA